MSANQDLFGDSSSEEEEAATAAEESNKPKPKSIHDDSDDDEDDNEFDDKGAIVGLPSSTMAGTKVNTPVQAERPEDGADDGSDVVMEEAAEPEGPEILPTKLVSQVHEKAPDDVRLYMTKLPNLVGIQTQTFDTATYAPAVEEEEFGQSAYNLLRWRYQRDDTGNLRRDDQDRLMRESNTRLVEWEDGSYTLHIGNDAFEVDAHDSSKKGFPGLNGYLYQSKTATIQQEDGPEESGGTILECTGPVRSRLTIRPSSLQSDAHKNLTVGIRQKTIKRARIAEIVTQEDPEKAKQERIRLKDDLEKANARKRSHGGGYRPSRPKMSRSYLEEEDDGQYDTFNVGKAKRQAKDGEEDDDGFGDYGDDSSSSEDEYDETFKRVSPTKKSKVDAAKDTAKDDDDDDDDEDEILSPVVKAKKSSKAVFDDSDSD